MPDIRKTNVDHESRSDVKRIEIKRGVTRRHFDRLFGFDKEHTEPTGASSSRSTDYMMSTLEDNTVPFNQDQIKALIERFEPIKGQLEDLNGKFDKMRLVSLEEFNQRLGEMRDQLQGLADQLNQIDRVGDYDRTKQNPRINNTYMYFLNTLKHLYKKCMLMEYRDIGASGKKARGEFKILFKDAIKFYKCLAEPLRDAQVKIWEKIYSEEIIADLMRNSEVISSKYVYGERRNLEKITLEYGLVGIWKPASKDDKYGTYKSEIAAYQLDKVLGMNIVPLTVERKIDGEEGSLQLWVNNMSVNSFLNFLTEDVKFFCKLIRKMDIGCEEWGGPRRNHGFVRDGSSWRVVLFDNADAFSTDTSYEWSVQLTGRELLEKVRQLNMDQLKDVQLTEEQKKALLARRTWLINNMERCDWQRMNDRQPGQPSVIHSINPFEWTY
jgi:hypothetical protein